jgi:DNA-binding NarL/FixJ family response regulator
MPSSSTATVLVVDDEILIRAGLAALMRAAPGLTVVGEAADGNEAVALAAETRPDVILMDIRMPGMDGITATERILAESPEAEPPRVIVLTTFDLDEYIYAALRAGASGFLLKETDPHKVIAAVQAVAAGDILLAPSVTLRLVEAYVRQPRTVRTPDAPSLSQLTPRELEILRLVGTGRTNTEIAGDLTVSEATIKTHLNRTMAKLRLTSRAQAVVVAYETGLVTPGHRA